MTREEAIINLKLSQNRIGGIKKEEWNALQMAIEALTGRPNGEWIKKQVFNPELDKYVPLIECSACGYEPYYGGSGSKYNYCPNCGTIMKGGAE